MAQNKEFSELAPKQYQLLHLLLNSRTKGEAVRKAGITLRTMHRCVADPDFRAAYRATRRDLVEDGLAVLKKGAVKAAQVLMDELDEETASAERSPHFIAAAKTSCSIAPSRPRTASPCRRSWPA